MEHGLEDLLVAAGHDADGAEQLEGGDLAAQVLRVEALRDHVNAGGVRQDVGTASLSGREGQTIQGDHSACSKPPVDIDLKVPF